jgi:hypothetical protein
MRDEDLFSNDGTPPTASDHERGGDSDRGALSSAPTVSQEAPSSAYPPKTERRLTARHPLRLLLVAMAVVALVVLAGGYGVFRAVSPTPRQTTSAFQHTRFLSLSAWVSSRGRMSDVASWWRLRTGAN